METTIKELTQEDIQTYQSVMASGEREAKRLVEFWLDAKCNSSEKIKNAYCFNTKHKTMEDCWNFIVNAAKKSKKGNMTCLSDFEVYKMAENYFLNDQIEKFEEKTIAKVVQKPMATATSATTTQTPKPIPLQYTPKSRRQINYEKKMAGMPSLFDTMDDELANNQQNKEIVENKSIELIKSQQDEQNVDNKSIKVEEMSNSQQMLKNNQQSAEDVDNKSINVEKISSSQQKLIENQQELAKIDEISNKLIENQQKKEENQQIIDEISTNICNFAAQNEKTLKIKLLKSGEFVNRETGEILFFDNERYFKPFQERNNELNWSDNEEMYEKYNFCEL